MATVTVLSAVTTAAVVAVAVRMTATEAAVAKLKKSAKCTGQKPCAQLVEKVIFDKLSDFREMCKMTFSLPRRRT